MAELLCDDDPEPCEPGPAGPLFVPVRPGPAGCVARLFRTPVGERTAVAFTTPQRLSAALGARQPWIRLSEQALRALAAPLGVSGLTLDPRLAAHPVGAAHLTPGERYGAAWRERDPRAVGAPRIMGAAASASARALGIG
ncbi:SAV_915 family protein [Streptomyces sp. NPDC006627]|uniref:SAV_915 family protein n=1 Tax=Streptomyces sp. NPDC006627 TaxID=3154679 RepID=UPI0033B17433